MGEFVMELWAFMRERQKFWLLPIILVLLMLGTLIVLTQGSAVAPFVYTLFESDKKTRRIKEGEGRKPERFAARSLTEEPWPDRYKMRTQTEDGTPKFL